MTLWAKLRSLFAKPPAPIERLANAILLRALQNGATVVYIDREGGVRWKIGSETETSFPPLARLYDPLIDQLQQMAGSDQRVGTIRLDIARIGFAVFELRRYGSDGVVMTIEENPYPAPNRGA